MSADMKNESVQGACAAYGCPRYPARLAVAISGCAFVTSTPTPTRSRLSPKRFATLNPSPYRRLDIRRYFGTDDWLRAYRGVQRRLIEAERRDLLINGDDVSVKAWLNRLKWKF